MRSLAAVVVMLVVAFKDNWIFAITVQNGKVAKIREYIDTQELARASQRDASGLA